MSSFCPLHQLQTHLSASFAVFARHRTTLYAFSQETTDDICQINFRNLAQEAKR